MREGLSSVSYLYLIRQSQALRLFFQADLLWEGLNAAVSRPTSDPPPRRRYEDPSGNGKACANSPIPPLQNPK